VTFVSKRYTQHGQIYHDGLVSEAGYFADEIIYFKVNFKSMIKVCVTYVNISILAEQKLQTVFSICPK